LPQLGETKAQQLVVFILVVRLVQIILTQVDQVVHLVLVVANFTQAAVAVELAQLEAME
jgi:hypothetical protein